MIRIRWTSLLLLGIAGLVVAACEPTATPPAVPPAKEIRVPELIPGGSIVVTVSPGLLPPVPSTVTIISATASVSHLGYAYKCKTVSVPPAIITFTVVVSDPAFQVKKVVVYYIIGSAPSDWDKAGTAYMVELTEISAVGSTRTWVGSTGDITADLVSEAAGETGFNLYWEAAAAEALAKGSLARTVSSGIPVEPTCTSPSDPSPTSMPPQAPPPKKEKEPPACEGANCPT